MGSIEAQSPYIRWFREIGIEDIPIVGGKNASLGEMYQALTPKGIRIPDGFALTAQAYRDFLRQSGLDAQIKQILDAREPGDLESLQTAGRRIREHILAASFPAEIEQTVLAAYDQLSQANLGAGDVAVRSSATAEDLPEASFAGQQESYLNVHGRQAVLDACKRCFASLFTDRAISYREHKGFDHFKIALSVGIQQMVRADLGAAGVMFSLDTETGFRDAVLINAAYGLGENVVQGTVNPDEYSVFKPTLLQGHRPILQKIAGTKEIKLVYDTGGSRMTKNIPVAAEQRGRVRHHRR
jgi:pyruvate, water dikinase